MSGHASDCSMTLIQWAIRHNVSHAALAELYDMWGISTDPESSNAKPGTEAAVQAAVRQEASERGMRLGRNNVGACKDDTGRVIRYGLWNDSKEMNKKIKSPDLIGINPVTITQAHVGLIIGQFVGREVKKPGWTYSGTEREVAQLKCGQLITRLGGDWKFCTGLGSFD